MFRRKKKIPAPLSEFPQGIFFKTEKGYFYIPKHGIRYRFITTRVLDSWHPPFIVEARESDPAVKKLRITAKMKFRNGSLLYSQANGKMYLISNNKRRHIVNPDILAGLGRRRLDAVWVSEAEINLHQEGEPLS